MNSPYIRRKAGTPFSRFTLNARANSFVTADSSAPFRRSLVFQLSLAAEVL